MGDEAPQLTVALATYNGRELLETALRSLEAQTLERFRIIVVDDASTDGTPEWLAVHWPELHVIVHPENRGVTAALNTGLRASASELTMLLNNDMELHPDCLLELVTAVTGAAGVGSACPKLLSFDDRRVLDGAGDTFNWGGVGWRRGHGERDMGQYDEHQTIFGACAGAALYTRRALEVVGLLDESFYAFYEDVDWSLRSQLAGFSCRYVPTAVAYHMGSATLGKGETDFTRYHSWRNGIWMVLKGYPGPLLLWQLPRLLLHQLKNAEIAARERKLLLLWRVWRDALLGLPAVLRQRRRIQRKRAVSLSQLNTIVRKSR